MHSPTVFVEPKRGALLTRPQPPKLPLVRALRDEHSGCADRSSGEPQGTSAEGARPRSEWLALRALAGFFLLSACSAEGSLADSTRGADRDAGDTKPRSEPDGQLDIADDFPVQLDAGLRPTVLPGTALEFTLSGRVYLDLSIPAVVSPSSSDTVGWDLLFDGLAVYTNSGAVGPGFGASFGPSSELDLLFDAAPAVPLRADVSDNAMLSWYWFGPNGVTSRFHTYGVRDASGRLFKLQILGYYDTSEDEPQPAVYTLRYAEVTPDGTLETVELGDIDASAGGVTLPPSSPAGCVKLAKGRVLDLAAAERSQSEDWDVCFQRTEVFFNTSSNAGLSDDDSSLNGGVRAVDLDLEPNTGADNGVTPSEQQQTPEGALARFDELDYSALSQPNLPWDREYETRARIGTRWLTGEIENPSPTLGSWIIRGANGESHYALYFTSVVRAADDTSTVSVQVKSVAPPTITQ